MIEYAELLENYQVDPDTLDPAAEPEAAWWTFANGLADDAANAVVSGTIVGDDLILTQNDGDTINAGNVRGPSAPAHPTPKSPPMFPARPTRLRH